MSAAFVTLSVEGLALYEQLRIDMPSLALYVHNSVETPLAATRFDRVVELTAHLFATYRELIYAAPCGVVVRALDGHLQHKTVDPAVVVVDIRARWCVSLLSGHEGGANALALRVGNALDAEPIITTTTEARKDLIVGIGCRRNAHAGDILAAVHDALALIGASVESVRLLASIDLKRAEAGLLETSAQLGIPLRFIRAAHIRAHPVESTYSRFVESSVGVAAVAEPAAQLAGRRTTLLLRKTVLHHVTVAIARECSWS